MNKSSLWDGFVCLIIIPCPPSSNCITAHQFLFALLEMLLRISAEPPSISCSLYQQRSGCRRLSTLLDLGLASPSSWQQNTCIFLVWSEPVYLIYTAFLCVVFSWVWAHVLPLLCCRMWAHDPHCPPACSALLGVGTLPIQIWSDLLNVFSRKESDLLFCCLNSGLCPY